MPEDSEELDPQEFPLPFGIDAETGELLSGVTEADLEGASPDPEEVRDRSERSAADFLAVADVEDPNDLTQAGWCVLFGSDVSEEVKAALRPLLERREAEANGRFKVFDGASALRQNEGVRSWIERQGAGFAAVDPDRGIPLYVLLVGSPSAIPFEFQYLLDLYWAVGRVHFDTPAEYEAYARQVVEYETAPCLSQKKRFTLFAVQNDADRATGLLCRQVAHPLAAPQGNGYSLVGYKGFELTPVIGEEATRDRLLDILRGRGPEGSPALLFTGSHGLRFGINDPELREKQGALLCRDWPGYGPTAPEHFVSAADVPDDAQVAGMIHYLFACYGGGCPTEDNFGRQANQPLRPLVPEPIVARLPQRLLAKGALASFAHVDRAWAYSFQNSRSAPQIQEMRDVMVRVLLGQRLGQAVDTFNLRWAVLATELDESKSARDILGPQREDDAAFANRLVARNDARNYIIIGDPAVHLRTDVMAG